MLKHSKTINLLRHPSPNHSPLCTHWSFTCTLLIHTISADPITKTRALKFYLQQRDKTQSSLVQSISSNSNTPHRWALLIKVLNMLCVHGVSDLNHYWFATAQPCCTFVLADYPWLQNSPLLSKRLIPIPLRSANLFLPIIHSDNAFKEPTTTSSLGHWRSGKFRDQARSLQNRSFFSMSLQLSYHHLPIFIFFPLSVLISHNTTQSAPKRDTHHSSSPPLNLPPWPPSPAHLMQLQAFTFKPRRLLISAEIIQD